MSFNASEESQSWSPAPSSGIFARTSARDSVVGRMNFLMRHSSPGAAVPDLARSYRCRHTMRRRLALSHDSCSRRVVCPKMFFLWWSCCRLVLKHWWLGKPVAATSISGASAPPCGSTSCSRRATNSDRTKCRSCRPSQSLGCFSDQKIQFL